MKNIFYLNINIFLFEHNIFSFEPILFKHIFYRHRDAYGYFKEETFAGETFASRKNREIQGTNSRE